MKKIAYSTIFAALIASVLIQPASAAGEVYPGVCAITSGATSHGNWVTIKCAKKSSPGNYVIRTTYFERDDKKTYRDLARFSGRRLSCDLVKGGTVLRSGTLITSYSLKNCK